MFKTRRMLEVEAALGKPLGEVIIETCQEMGLCKAAQHMGVTYQTFVRWAHLMGIKLEVVRVARRVDEAAPGK